MTSNKKIFEWFLFLIILQESEEFFLRRPRLTFKLIRGNASSFEIEDTDEENLEYTRYNNQTFQKIRRRWTKYYSCLQRLRNREQKPEIRLLYEGQHTEFHCDICPRPFQNFDELEWKYKPLLLDDEYELEYLDLTHEMVLTKNKTLRIFNVVEDYAGLYVCYQRRNIISVHILEVSKKNIMEKVSSTETEDKNFIILEGQYFKINYQWTRWTECSSCGGVGRKYKYGTCFISSTTEIPVRENCHIRAKKKNETLSSGGLNFYEGKKKFLKNSSSEDNIYKNHGVGKIKKFLTGIPCASRYLPSAAIAYAQQYVPIKVLVKYCLESCYKYQIFEVFDRSGRVIEIANNSAGVYSVFQQIPKLNPDIERRSVTAEFGQNIIIQCPGTLLTTIPVTWKINNKIILPEIVAHDSEGRFIVDLVNRIQIKKLRLKDSHIYSCWQRNQLIGTFNLIVEKKFNTNLNHHVTLVGITILIGICLLIGKKLITEELRNRKK